MFIGVVDAELLKAVEVEIFKTENVKDSDRVSLSVKKIRMQLVGSVK